MPTLTIEQGDARASFVFTGTPRLQDAVAQAGFTAEAPCGGRGTCGQCAVLALGGAVSPPTEAERRAGVRLMCQTRLLGDAWVRLHPARAWVGIETGAGVLGAGRPATAQQSAQQPATGQIAAGQPADGQGGVDQPLAAQADVRQPAAEPYAGQSAAGQRVSPSTAGQMVAGVAATGQPVAGRYGAAVDLGTTTVAARVYDLQTGQPLGEHALVNPQTAVAADVMGRLSAALAGGGARLRAMAEAAVRDAVAGACRAAGVPRADQLCVAGNTVMLTLLTGRDPAPLAVAPFAAACLFGFTEAVCGVPAYLPPCAGAFMGADMTCAALAAGLADGAETALLCDIGTNGELMLRHGGALYAASAPAGPAFEGGQISRGVGGVRGAIDRVWAEGGKLACHVIGGGRAIGVCGSGVIDTVAALLTLGLVNRAGAAEAEAFTLTDGVAFTAADVRAVQLAKAAVCAAAGMLLDAAGVQPPQVRRVNLAGGFGSHVRVAGAAAIGLLPAQLMVRAQAVGNAALAGAAMLLLDGGLRAQAERIAADAKVLQLGGDEGFERRFFAAMDFPVAEEE